MEHFHLEPEFFPHQTRDLFSVDLILKHGTLPLGFKTRFSLFKRRQFLNVGVLDKRDRTTVEALVRSRVSKVEGVQFFQLDPEEFLAVLRSVYSLTEDRLQTPEVHPLLTAQTLDTSSPPSPLKTQES